MLFALRLVCVWVGGGGFKEFKSLMLCFFRTLIMPRPLFHSHRWLVVHSKMQPKVLILFLLYYCFALLCDEVVFILQSYVFYVNVVQLHYRGPNMARVKLFCGPRSYRK